MMPASALAWLAFTVTWFSAALPGGAPEPSPQQVVETALPERVDARGDDADHLAASVILMGPGDELFSRWGHIGLRIDDRRSGIQKVYNFGTFDFRGVDDLWRYAQGFLRFRLSTSSWSATRWSYAAQNRDVWVCPLQLSPEQERELDALLEVNALPENRYYDYRHYLDNCATRIRDAIDEVTAGALTRSKEEEADPPRTFRDWTRQYLIGTPVMRSLILFALGPSVDQPISRWQEYFLPDNLVLDLQSVENGDGEPLVTSCVQVVERRGPMAREYVPLWEQLLIGLVGLLALLTLVVPLFLGGSALGRRLHGGALFLWGLIGGGGGIGLAAFWLATQHDDTWHNENLLAFVPLHILLVFFGAKMLYRGELARKWVRVLRWYLTGALGVLMLAVLLKLGPLVQDNWTYLGVAAAVDLLLLARVLIEERNLVVSSTPAERESRD